MFFTNHTPTPSSEKEKKGDPSAQPREHPKEKNQENTPNANESNNFEKGLSLNVKIKKECDVFVATGEFFEGQHMYYFPAKNHILWNPKIPMCGPFLISKIHTCGVIDILLDDHKSITINGKRLRPYKKTTTRTIWRPK